MNRAKAVSIPLISLAVFSALTLTLLIEASRDAFAYPPAVGILAKSKNCLACHVNNGPWKDDKSTIIDIIDSETKSSFRQADGSFIIDVKRGEVKTVKTVIGQQNGEESMIPYRNAWLYVDPKTIETGSLSKFAPGWEVNLPMACRIVGDRLEGYEDAHITVLPMSIRPSDAAQDAKLMLQVMLTAGESVKGNAKEGMVGSYFERSLKLRVLD